MRLLAPISALLLLAGISTGLLAFQRGGYSGDEYGGAREAFSSSDNENGKNEYSWSRLRYSMAGGGSGLTAVRVRFLSSPNRPISAWRCSVDYSGPCRFIAYEPAFAFASATRLRAAPSGSVMISTHFGLDEASES